MFSWTSKGIIEENIKNLSTRDNSFAPMLIGKSLISTVKYNTNLYISYELDK